MIKGVKHISSESRCEFGGGKYNSQQKWNSDKCQQEDHARSICACEYDKFCEISEQLKNCTYTKLLVDGILVICNKIVDMPETASINPNDKTNYWHIAVALSAIVCLLLQMVIAVGYHMKPGLTTPCLLLYQYIMLEYERTDVFEGIDIDKTDDSRECTICHQLYFLRMNFRFQTKVCGGCDSMT